MLFNHLGNEIKSGLNPGSDALEFLPLVLLCDPVFTQAGGQLKRVREGFNVGGIYGVELVHKVEDAGELPGIRWDIIVIEAQAGKPGDLFHIGPYEGHRSLLFFYLLEIKIYHTYSLVQNASYC
jgi:hypothetical protein